MHALLVGALVVLPAEPALGLARLERLITQVGHDRGGDGSGAPLARVFLYADGAFVVRPLDQLRAAPPGVWPPSGR